MHFAWILFAAISPKKNMYRKKREKLHYAHFFETAKWFGATCKQYVYKKCKKKKMRIKKWKKLIDERLPKRRNWTLATFSLLAKAS